MSRLAIAVGAGVYLVLVLFTLALLSANKSPQDTEVTDASSLIDGENSLQLDNR